MTLQDHPAGQGAVSRTEAMMDIAIGYVLLIGVALSAILVIIGLIWRWIATGHLGMDYIIRGMNLYEFVVYDIKQVTTGAFRPRLLVSLGIATLMLTPYVRVLASLLFFLFVERNWKYSVFTGFVFAVLTYSLFLR